LTNNQQEKEQQTLLIVDDREDVLKSYAAGFARTNYRILTADSGSKALDILDEEDVDTIITDLKMPGMDGLEFLKHTQDFKPAPVVIITTAYGTIESAVEAMRLGAYDYITKPVDLQELRIKVERAMEKQALVKQNIYLLRQIDSKFGFQGIIGETQEMVEVVNKVKQLAPTKATILITGESGTGKEVIAKAIHFNSDRANKPFIPLHCAALPAGILESELFGHEKGSFTGAIAMRKGRFELAHKGTLFLDEVGDIPLEMQVKLLRVIETKEFLRVGGVQSVIVDVRLIAASNKDLQEEIKEGRFREDLYYRLKVAEIQLPPLRRRKADIPKFVKNFIEEASKEHNKKIDVITKEAMNALINYSWHGNVRELKNTIENIVIFATTSTIEIKDIPENIRNFDREENVINFKVGMPLDQIELEAIQQTLVSVDGNRTKAAELLGISRRTLQRKLKEYGID